MTNEKTPKKPAAKRTPAKAAKPTVKATKSASTKKATAKALAPAAPAVNLLPRAESTEVAEAVDAALAPRAVTSTHGTTQHIVVARGGTMVSLLLDGGPGLVPWSGALDTRLPLFVTWLMDAPALARPDVQLKAVTLHSRIGELTLAPVLVSDDRLHEGELVRLPTRVELPVGATGELEYWFEVETATGETLWHSNYGRNFRLPLLGSETVEPLTAMLDAAGALKPSADLRS